MATNCEACSTVSNKTVERKEKSNLSNSRKFLSLERRAVLTIRFNPPPIRSICLCLSLLLSLLLAHFDFLSYLALSQNATTKCSSPVTGLKPFLLSLEVTYFFSSISHYFIYLQTHFFHSKMSETNSTILLIVVSISLSLSIIHLEASEPT